MKSYFFIAISIILIACGNPSSDSQAQTSTPAAAQPNAPAAQQVTPGASNTLTGTYWKVVEVNGQNVENKTAKEMHFLFDPASPQFKGHTGCNMIMGEAKRTGNNQIRFINLLNTEAACNTPDLNKQFQQAVESITEFNITGNTLLLKKDASTVLIKCVAKG